MNTVLSLISAWVNYVNPEIEIKVGTISIIQCCEKVSIPHQENVVFHYYSNKLNLSQIKVVWTWRVYQALITRMKTKTNYKAITLE